MKKAAIFSAILVLLTIFPACQMAKDTEELAVRRIEKKLTGTNNEVNYSVDYPESHNMTLNTAIAEFISEEMGSKYTGDYANGDSLVNFYAQEALKGLNEIHADIEDEMTYSEDFTITKIYDTERIVTFEVQTYNFTGGAHGYGVSYGATFRKSDGRKINANVLPANIAEDSNWKKLMKEGMKSYFEVKSDSELQNCIDVDINDLPMPEAAPYFNEEGMVLIYQSYEIACYAAGQPVSVIPYSKLERYMNATGKSLFY